MRACVCVCRDEGKATIRAVRTRKTGRERGREKNWALSVTDSEHGLLQFPQLKVTHILRVSCLHSEEEMSFQPRNTGK